MVTTTMESARTTTNLAKKKAATRERQTALKSVKVSAEDQATLEAAGYL